MKEILKSITPAQLKKYGMYSLLSFFITVSVVLGFDALKIRDTDIRYERKQTEELRVMLNDQYKLKLEQEQLLKMEGIKLDTTHIK